MGSSSRLAGLLVVAIALTAAACSPMAGFGLTVHREGNQLNIVVPGYREANTHGFLCPADPGPGLLFGEEGTTRLLRTGCLDLGVTDEIDPGATGWSTSINLESLASAQLEAFGNRDVYRLVLVSGDEDERKAGRGTDPRRAGESPSRSTRRLCQGRPPPAMP